MIRTLKSVVGSDDNQQLHVLFGLQALTADVQAVGKKCEVCCILCMTKAMSI